jgi:WD40 repeat protein
MMAAARSLATPQAGRAPVRVDASGDLLPGGALLRFGSPRLWQPRVNYLAFSPDGRLLAGANENGGLRLWRVRDGKEMACFWTARAYSYGHEAPLAFSPDGTSVALGCYDKTVRVWDVRTGRERHRWKVLAWANPSIAFSPDGRGLAAIDQGAVQVWDVASGTSVGRWPDSDRVHAIAYTADGSGLVTVAFDEGQRARIVRWHDASTGKVRLRERLPGDPGWADRLSPDGKVCAVATVNGRTIRLWGTATGKLLAETEGLAHRPSVSAFSGDGRLLTAANDDGALRVWAVGTGRLVREYRAHPGSVQRVALSRDGKLLACVTWADDAIHIWDVGRAREHLSFAGHRGHPLHIAFSADGKSVATTSRDFILQLDEVREWAEWSLRRWDAVTGRELHIVRAPDSGEVVAAAFSSDGRALATLNHAATLRVWDVEGGRELRRLQVPTWKDAAGHTHAALGLSGFTPDGTGVWGLGFRSIHTWDVHTGKERPRVPLPPGTIDCSAASPDRRSVALNDQDRGIILLDLRTGLEVRRLANRRPRCWGLFFSPDGRTLASAEPGCVRLWEVAAGQERACFTTGPDQVSAVAFSPDGRTLAAATWNINFDAPPSASRFTIEVWDLPSARRLTSFRGHRATVHDLRFAPDGSTLASAGQDNTALLWDMRAVLRPGASKAAPLPAKALDDLWHDLAGPSAARAHRAAWKLSDSPGQAVTLLKGHLQPGLAPDQRLVRLVADLDANRFRVREQAAAELERLGRTAEAALRRALESRPSPEQRRRVEALLSKLSRSDAVAASPDLVPIRVLEVLERIGTPEARAVVAEVAGGDPKLALTQDAKEVLARFKVTPAKKP